jgi:very-short-patch-repair endonuclease
MALNTAALGSTGGLFTRAEALAAGLTDRDLRSPEYQRVVHGVYRTSSTPLTHELRCRAVAMKLPPHAVITGRSAATLHGVSLARPHDPVEVIVEGGKRFHGVRNWNVHCHASETRPWCGVRLATPERTAVDLLTRNSLQQGVALCDAMLHAGLVDKDALGRVLRDRHDDGIVRARKAFELLDGRAESIPESVLRVLMVLEGLRPVPQLEVPTDFGGVFRVDLGFERAKVAVEYEGAWHADPEQFRRDERRREWLRAKGWLVIVVTADDLATDPRNVIAEIREAVRARL